MLRAPPPCDTITHGPFAGGGHGALFHLTNRNLPPVNARGGKEFEGEIHSHELSK